jgi:hypothetical protein
MPYTVEDAKADLAAAYVIFLSQIGLSVEYPEECAELYEIEYRNYSDIRDKLGTTYGTPDFPGRYYDSATLVRSYCDEGCEEPNIIPIWNRANAASARPYDFSF